MLFEKLLISVVIPCTDRTQGLQKCLVSVLNQLFSGQLEVILVENNSKDREIVPAIVCALNDSRVRHVYLENCENANWARNFGEKESKGNYIAYLDSDDWWDKNHIASCLNFIEKKHANAVYSGYKLHDGLSVQEKRSRQIVNESAYTFLFGKNRGVAQTSSFILNKNVFLDCSWDESLKRSQDYDFFVGVQNTHGWHCKPDLTVNVFWEAGVVRSPSVSAFKAFYGKHSLEMTDIERACYLGEALKSLALHSKHNFLELHEIFKAYRNKLRLIDRLYLYNYYSAIFAARLKLTISKLKSWAK